MPGKRTWNSDTCETAPTLLTGPSPPNGIQIKRASSSRWVRRPVTKRSVVWLRLSMSGELNRHSLPAVLGANQAFNHYKHSSAPPCTGLRNKAERRGPRHKPCFATLEIARSTGHSTVKLSLVACKSSNGGRVDSPLRRQAASPDRGIEELMASDMAAFFRSPIGIKGYCGTHTDSGRLSAVATRSCPSRPEQRTLGRTAPSLSTSFTRSRAQSEIAGR